MLESMHSDQGRTVESQFFEEMCHLLEINRTRLTAYHPEGNRRVENLHKTLENMLTARVEVYSENSGEHSDYWLTEAASIPLRDAHYFSECLEGR